MGTVVLVEPIGSGVQALGSITRAGHRAVVITSPMQDYLVDDAARAHRQAGADLILSVPDVHDLPAVLGALSDGGVALEDVVGVCTTLHISIIAAAQLAAHLNLPHTPPDVLRAARNKGRCRELLDAAGVPNLRHGVADGLEQALAIGNRIGYPVMIKPSNGGGKLQAVIARREEDLRWFFTTDQTVDARRQPALFAQLDGSFVIEELAVGELYSVEVAFDGQRWTPLITIRRKVGRDNPILELGSTVPCGLSPADEDEMTDYAVRACRAVGLGPGVFHVEIIATSAGPRLVEVNPRCAGGAIPDLIATATGCNLYDVIIDIAIGKPGPPLPFPLQNPVSHSFITSAEEHTVRADLPDDWFEAYRPRIHSGWSSIKAESRLRPMGGNFDVYGLVRVVAQDSRVAEEQCAGLLTDIGATVGLPPVPVAGR